MKIALLGMLSATPSAAAEAADPRIAVIAIGQDSILGGALQQWIEGRLAPESGFGFVLVSSDEIARRLAARIPAPAGEEARLADLLGEAKENYFDGKLIDALDRVSEAARIVEAGLGGPGADQVTILTWRTALQLAMRNTAQAEEEGRLLLAIAPEMEPDLNVFPPSFGRFVSELRLKLPRPVDVRLDGVPDGARVDVDGRLVESRFRIAAGKHRLRLRAAGFRQVSLGFDAQSDLVVSVAPMLDLTKPEVAEVDRAIWDGVDNNAVVRLAQELAVDAVLIASARSSSSMRAVLAPGRGELRRSDRVSADRAGAFDLARWAIAELGAANHPEGQTGTLVLETPVAADVLIDSRPIGKRTTANRTASLPVRIGKVSVRLEAAGYEPFDTTVEIRPGRPTTLKADMRRKPQSVAASATPTPVAKKPLARQPLFWGAVAAGVVAIGAGAAVAASQGGGGTEVRDGTPSDENTTIVGW